MPDRRAYRNRFAACISLTALASGGIYLDMVVSWRQMALLFVGAAAGSVLYRTAFGFTSAWRAFIVDRRGGGVRAQMLMIGATSLVLVPALGSGRLFGTPVRGAVSPLGISVVVGAFLFGVGMQLAGACASGTLSAAGSGNTRLLATFGAVISGSVIGLAHMPWWQRMPAFAPVSLVHRFGPFFALSTTLALCATVGALTLACERRGTVDH